MPPADEVRHSLPDLPGADQAPGHFSLDEESAVLGYESRFRKWGAKLDEYTYLSPSLSLNYGTLLTDRFGAGATVTRHSGYSDVLVNGVYAPKRNLRLRLATGQLRSDYASDSGSNPILQNSYLVDIKKNSGAGRFVSNYGLTAYTVRATGAGHSSGYDDLSALAGEDVLDASDLDPGTWAAGRLDGYTLNFGLQPTPYSRIELRRERSHLRYRFDGGFRGDEFRDVNHIGFSQYLNNCARFQGRYSGGADSRSLDLSVTKHKWRISLSHGQNDGVSDSAIQLGYAIPIGRSSGASGDCSAKPAPARGFGPLVDATVARPSSLPREPLASY